jgi:cytochrome c oxidase cbb3-type subunit 1
MWEQVKMKTEAMGSVHGTYDYQVVRQFALMTVVWGIVGMLVGVVIAAQLVWPQLNVGEWFHFGRLRPLHTSGVIFAFGGNALICTSFWVVQRTCPGAAVRRRLSWFVFWGYQLFIVLAATGLCRRHHPGQGIRRARVVRRSVAHIVWVGYLLVFLGTIWKRKEPHIYVANWFYLAFIVTVAVLHLVNNAAVPVGLLEFELFAFAGVQAPDPVVVRPQRGRLLPDRRLPRP